VAKPFSIQSPEDIAKEYAGNKQKIAEAMQLGIVDPTAGVLAGMFIDRMRAGQMQEGMPQSTVAQQVMGGAPPAAPVSSLPAGGLGDTPQAALPMTPEMGMAPPMPQEAGMAPPMPQEAPMGMPPEGQMPMMAGGGLAMLPVPDTMFDEPTNGGFNDGYAGGGIVAFNPGGLVEEEEDDGSLPTPSGQLEILVPGLKRRESKAPRVEQGMMYAAPSTLGGLRNDLLGNLDLVDEAAPRETKRAKELEALLERDRSPEERAKRKKEDMWMTLAQIGAKMATTPGSLLQAAGAGIQEALPGAAEAAKERRGEERALTRELLAEEREANKEVESRANLAFEMLKNYNSLEQAFQDQNFKNTLTRLGIDAEIVKARIMAGASVQGALISAAAQKFVGGLGYDERRGSIYQQIASDWDKSALRDSEYMGLFATDPVGAAKYRNDAIMGVLDRIMPARGGDDPLGMRPK